MGQPTSDSRGLSLTQFIQVKTFNQRTLISVGQSTSKSQGLSLTQFLQAKICVHVLKQLHRMDCDRKLLGRERDRKRDREVFD